MLSGVQVLSLFFCSQALLFAHASAPGPHELDNPVLLMCICLPAFQLSLTSLGQQRPLKPTLFRAPGPLISISRYGCFLKAAHFQCLMQFYCLRSVCILGGPDVPLSSEYLLVKNYFLPSLSIILKFICMGWQPEVGGTALLSLSATLNNQEKLDTTFLQKAQSYQQRIRV